MRNADVKNLYYITHISNISSILRHGILSHAEVENRNVHYTPIYDLSIVNRRRDIPTPDGQRLWNFANLYFQPRNPMLYRVISEKDKRQVVIVAVKPEILQQSGTLISTGNAASSASEIMPTQQGIKDIYQMWSVIKSEWWNPDDGSKRKIMAECLVPQRIDPACIDTIYVADHAAADNLKKLAPDITVPVIPEPHMFFQPIWSTRLTDKMSLVEGDMFFSNMQTLTVSVNTVGIMGKGLASRAKHQFPDVYVVYQDACRRKALQMGKPYLYKRESLIDEQLADEPLSLPNPNSNKWFLLFATKKSWRQDADFNGIEEGLRWLKDNYKNEGIKSLAMPALGCGLGNLAWRDVGPLMCKFLAALQVQVAIYLPREREMPKDLLSPKFLFGA